MNIRCSVHFVHTEFHNSATGLPTISAELKTLAIVCMMRLKVQTDVEICT
jgi:hypothetical protein